MWFVFSRFCSVPLFLACVCILILRAVCSNRMMRSSRRSCRRASAVSCSSGEAMACGTQRWRLIDPARLQSLAGPSEGVAIYLQAVRNLSALRRNRGWRKPARLLHWWTSRRQPQLSSSALHNAARARNWGAGRSLEHAQIACHASSGQDQGVVQGSFLNLKSLQNEVGCEAYCSTNTEHCSRALIDAPCV